MGLKHFIPFVENPAHFFECVVPPAPEQLVWKNHPTYPPLWANNAGYLEWRDDYWQIQKGNYSMYRGMYWTHLVRERDVNGVKQSGDNASVKRLRLASAGRLVFECFNGQAQKGARIMRINHNPYDDRPGNFDFHRTYPDHKGWLRSNTKFVYQTHKQMWLREVGLVHEIAVEDYFKEVLMIPHEYRVGYQKFKKLNGYIGYGNNS